MTGTPGRAGIAPMNGAAGGAIGLGVVALLLSIALGFAAVPFAILGAVVGALAVLTGARGRAFAHQSGSGHRLATIGTFCGALAVVIGLAGILAAVL